MRWMVRGDIDGFFGLALDNLVQLLLIDSYLACTRAASGPASRPSWSMAASFPRRPCRW